MGKRRNSEAEKLCKIKQHKNCVHRKRIVNKKADHKTKLKRRKRVRLNKYQINRPIIQRVVNQGCTAICVLDEKSVKRVEKLVKQLGAAADIKVETDVNAVCSHDMSVGLRIENREGKRRTDRSKNISVVRSDGTGRGRGKAKGGIHARKQGRGADGTYSRIRGRGDGTGDIGRGKRR